MSFFGNVLSKIQFEARFREICKADFCSLSLCFLSLQFLKRPEISFWNKKFRKGKKKMARVPPFFDFFVLKCTYMETYNSHPEFYGNIKGHATILWKHITF